MSLSIKSHSGQSAENASECDPYCAVGGELAKPSEDCEGSICEHVRYGFHNEGLSVCALPSSCECEHRFRNHQGDEP